MVFAACEFKGDYFEPKEEKTCVTLEGWRCKKNENGISHEGVLCILSKCIDDSTIQNGRMVA